MAVMLLVSEEVKDYDSWRVAYEANRPMRDKAGLVEHFVGRDADRPNVVHMGLVAPSFEVAQRFLNNPELLNAMAVAGVANVPNLRYVLLG